MSNYSRREMKGAVALNHEPGDDSDQGEASPARRRPGRPSAQAQEGEIDTRNHILARARELFMHRGFAGVSVGEVAAAVGVTKPTLYYHFHNKEGLYVAVLCDMMSEVGGHIRRSTEASLALKDQLVDLAHGYFLHANVTMEPMLRDTSELIDPRHAALVWDCYEQEIFGPTRRLMSEAIERGEMRPGDIDIYVCAFLSLLDGLSAPGGHSARTSDEHRQVAEALVGIFLEGALRRS